MCCFVGVEVRRVNAVDRDATAEAVSTHYDALLMTSATARVATEVQTSRSSDWSITEPSTDTYSSRFEELFFSMHLPFFDTTCYVILLALCWALLRE